MTARLDDAGEELGELAATRIGAGEWPWSFYCYLEERPRPVTPSSFLCLAPGDALGLAVRCPVCASISVNLVSGTSTPFWNDPHVGVVAHVFADDASRVVEEFRAELFSTRFDERRLDLQ